VLNYGTPGVGSSAHLAGECSNRCGHQYRAYPLQRRRPAAVDLLAGQIQLGFANPTSVALHIKSGRLRALAVTTLQPTNLLPGCRQLRFRIARIRIRLDLWFVGAGEDACRHRPAPEQGIRARAECAEAKEKFFNFAMEPVAARRKNLPPR